MEVNVDKPAGITARPPRPKVESAPEIRHPRGQIRPPLPAGSPRWRRIVRALVRLVQGLHFHDALRVAPAMAFHFFLSLLPLLVFVGYVVALIARKRGVNTVLAPLLDNLPATTEAMVKSEVTRLAGASRLGPLSAVSFLWIASGGTHGLMNAVEAVIGTPRRAWWKQRLIALGWVVGSLIGVGVVSFGIIQWDGLVHPSMLENGANATSSTSDANPQTASASPSVHAPAALHPHVPSAAASSATGAAPSASAPQPAPRRPRIRIFRGSEERGFALTLSLALAIAGLAGFYRFSISHSKRIKRRVLPGAVLAVALWIVVTWGFSLYVRTLAGYAVFYGSLAAVAVLLVWLWLVSLSILVGAELNSQLEGIRD